MNLSGSCALRNVSSVTAFLEGKEAIWDARYGQRHDDFQDSILAKFVKTDQRTSDSTRLL